MSVRVAPLLAGLAAGVVLSIAAPACSDIDGAFDDYCRRNEATTPERLAGSCQTEADCCPGWRCSGGTCGRSQVIDSGTTSDAGEDLDAGVDADAGTDAGLPSCLPLGSACTSVDQCCADAYDCAANDLGISLCVATLCRDLEAGCGADDECCSGQCLGPVGAATCKPTATCVPLGSNCLDDRDCCGAGFCKSDGDAGVCTAPVSQGVEVGGNSCGQDSECASGQCLNSLCDAVEACFGLNGGCADLNDCCGGWRCRASTGSCVAPEITPDRSCSGSGVYCVEAKECCSNQCTAGTCG